MKQDSYDLFMHQLINSFPISSKISLEPSSVSMSDSNGLSYIESFNTNDMQSRVSAKPRIPLIQSSLSVASSTDGEN